MAEKKENIQLKFDLQRHEIEIPVFKEPEDLPFKLPNDETGGRHSLNSETCNQIISQGSATIHPLNERSLDSVFEYTNKIRIFLGLGEESANDGSLVDANSHIVNSEKLSKLQPEEKANVDKVLSDNIDSSNSADILITSSEGNHISSQQDNILPGGEGDVLVDSNPDIVKSEALSEIQPKEEINSDEVCDKKIDPESVVNNLKNSRESISVNNEPNNFSEHVVPLDSNDDIVNSVQTLETQPSQVTYADDLFHKNIGQPIVTNTFSNLTENRCDPKSLSSDYGPNLNSVDLCADIENSEQFSRPPEEKTHLDELCEGKVYIPEGVDNNIHLSESNSVSGKFINISSEDEHNLSSEVSSADIGKSEQFSEFQPEEESFTYELRDGIPEKVNFVGNLINCSASTNVPKETKHISSEDDDILATHIEPDKINEKIDKYDNTYPSSEETDQIPNLASIRRLSTEIVSKVLDTAENQLRDMLSNKKKSISNDKESLLKADFKQGRDFADGTTRRNEKLFANLDVGNNFQQDGERGISALSELSTFQPFQNSIDRCQDSKPINEIQLKDVLAKTYSAHDFQKKIELEMNKFDPRYDIDPDTICGIGSFKPKWIQRYATPRMYLVLYSIIGILSGSYYAYLISCMSTIEKRFAFKSKISGIIMVFDEITPLVLGVFVGYLGGKSHRPRMLGFGMLLASVCCFVSALPYFIYGPATHASVLNKREKSVIDLCDGRNHGQDCDSDSLPPTLAAVLLLTLGSFLKGFGNLAYYAIGLTYMDDNAKKRNTPMYFAVAIALRLLGPFLGYLMSSYFLKFHENPFGDPGFGPDDPRWIGGWWMGFLLQGVLLFLFTIPMTLFPRRLPGHPKLPSTDSNETGLKSNAIGLLAALKRLVKNPLFVFLNLNFIMIVFGNFGHYIMLPKYMENQFRLSASEASLFSGPPAIVAVIISTLTGGYLIWKFKPSPRFLIGVMIVLEIIGVIGYLLLMIPRCEHVEMTSFGSSNDWLLLEDTCNANCNCSSSIFHPVCGPDGGSLYFSPCYAGCNNNLNHTFSNCSCISDQSGKKRDFVTDGFCVNKDCWSQALAYLISMPIMALVTNLCKVANSMLLLRCVKPNDKSVAMGTFEAFICLFGFIPFPVFFGALVDSACLVWENSCGQRGNCWYYDASTFNLSLHGVSAGFTFMSVLCLCAIYYHSGRLETLYDDDEQENENLSEIE